VLHKIYTRAQEASKRRSFIGRLANPISYEYRNDVKAGISIFSSMLGLSCVSSLLDAKFDKDTDDIAFLPRCQGAHSPSSEIHCFPGTALAMTEEGPIELNHLNTGQHILVRESQTGKLSYSPIIYWIHRDYSAYPSHWCSISLSNDAKPLDNFQIISTCAHQVVLSNNEMIHVSSLTIGDKVIGYNYQKTHDRNNEIEADTLSVNVVKIEKGDNYVGLFSPVTEGADEIWINGIFVSSFTVPRPDNWPMLNRILRWQGGMADIVTTHLHNLVSKDRIVTQQKNFELIAVKQWFGFFRYQHKLESLINKKCNAAFTNISSYLTPLISQYLSNKLLSQVIYGKVTTFVTKRLKELWESLYPLGVGTPLVLNVIYRIISF